MFLQTPDIQYVVKNEWNASGKTKKSEKKIHINFGENLGISAHWRVFVVTKSEVVFSWIFFVSYSTSRKGKN